MTNRPIPNTLKVAAICAASFYPVPGIGADLVAPPRPAAGAMLPPVMVDEDAVLCTLKPSTPFYRRPYSQPFGPLPAGLVVEVIDVPFSTATDMFVRIMGPTDRVYYGYVRTPDLACD